MVIYEVVAMIGSTTKQILVVVTDPDVDAMGTVLYQKGLNFGKWISIIALCVIAFKYLMNKKDQAGEHFSNVVRGVFLLVLAPTIIALLFWIASLLKV